MILIVLIILAGYLPSLQYEFAPGDQWRAFQYSLLDEPALEKAIKCYYARIYFDIRTGRPLCSIGECLEHALVGKIADFSTFRPLPLIAVILTAFCLGLTLSPALGGFENGTAAGALFVFSPGYAFIYFRGLSTIMLLVAVIFAALSYLLLRRALNNQKKIKAILFSAFFFLLGCMIYPAWAFVVFIFALVDFLFCLDLDACRRFMRLSKTVAFYMTFSMAYYLIIKVMIYFTPYTGTSSSYAFSAHFSPTYLLGRYLTALRFYLAQPPLNSLVGTIHINLFLILLFALMYAYMHSGTDRKIRTFLSTMIVSLVLLFMSIIPWLMSSMANTGNRYFVTFSLFMCAIVCWMVIRLGNALFPKRWYIPAVLLIVIVLLPSSAVQNKRSLLEAATSNIEIQTMRGIIHQWIDSGDFRSKRYIVVVQPGKLRPAFAVRFMNDEKYEQADSHLFCGNPEYYFQMFTALIREKCDCTHPLIGDMNIYNTTLLDPEMVETILDSDPRGIVFKVIKQGVPLRTRHDVLVINFSMITGRPEALIIKQPDY